MTDKHSAFLRRDVQHNRIVQTLQRDIFSSFEIQFLNPATDAGDDRAFQVRVRQQTKYQPCLLSSFSFAFSMRRRQSSGSGWPSLSSLFHSSSWRLI